MANNILFLTQIIPYPPDAGPKVKTWHVLRYLVERGHQVTLASFVRPEEEVHVPVLRELCDSVHTVPIHRSRIADVGYFLRSNLTKRPFLIERDDLAGMRSLVNRLLITNQIDVIHADQLTMTQFALSSRNPRKNGDETTPRPIRLFDAHNAVWTIIERMQQNAPWFLKSVLSLEAQRIKRYEGMIVQKFDNTLAVTEQDKEALLLAIEKSSISRNNTNLPITVIPIAVDTNQLQPIRRKPGALNILTLGTLHYPPNADGIRWFAREVFPHVHQQVPGASLTIIGKNPPSDFIDLASKNPRTINVTGYMPDLTPYLENAALMVVPVRAGGGMRVRILEAFARAIPVVTTTVGLEGIEAMIDRDVLVEDSPTTFAAAVVRLLNDETLQAKLANNGRYLAETHYDWKVVFKKLDTVYEDINSLRAKRGN